MAMRTRKLGPFDVELVGLGCMNLSHAYGAPPPPDEARRLIARAYDLGVRHFDTAALYGFGANEQLVGPAVKPWRDQILLASKCGMTGVDGVRVIDGRPETIMRTCEAALQRLQTDVIDLYYLHRWDKTVPVEDSAGALARLKEQGKIRAAGLSEVSAATLRKAQAVTPIAAVQSEYSLWTRNPEIALLQACEELGAAFVAFSPLGRGFLADAVHDAGLLAPKDIRRGMPRFQAPQFAENLKLQLQFRRLAEDAGVLPGILALNWVIGRGEHVHVIPGTTSIDHLEQNIEAEAFDFPPEVLAAAEALFDRERVAGARYNAATQAEVDTEEF